MNIIVNVDLDWGIGKAGQLLVYLPADLRQFKRLTSGHTIVYGRRTLASFPQGDPLPNRKNIMLSRRHETGGSDLILCRSLPELAARLQGIHKDQVYLVGGASLYRQLLPYCDKALVTQVFKQVAADAFFPDLDRQPGWRRVATGPVQMDTNRLDPGGGPLAFRLCLYQNERTRPLAQLMAEG